ncbi:2'-5' RNA ligase family protein [Streptomyces sp. NPDC051940]|uniref:2'-5' RNA ligase family protein n=1 Tax=Streptomyces sp. NPDC051940 TaxID=3155675 RepID=UPI00341A0D1C
MTAWPDVSGDTALSIRVPHADALVRTGIPAHVTVLYPFLHESRLTTPVHAELAALLRTHDAFDLTFAEFTRYPGVLCLDPWPADPVRALTKALRDRWPQAVPYRGIFGDEGLAPHLTVANHEGPDTWEAAYTALEAELAPRLPVTAAVTHVDLIVWDGTAWHPVQSLPLRRPEP